MSDPADRKAPIVIVGSGLAGWSTVRELRKLERDLPLLMISADNGDFYAKPSLSNAWAQQRAPQQLVTTPAAQMAQSLGVSLLQHTRVEAIDPAQRLVRTRQGDFGYRQLVLATGAQPVRLPLEGDAAHEVLSVNSLDDFATLHSRLTQGPVPSAGKRVLVIGAGLIGCEFANDFAAAGLRVAVVDPGSGPLGALLPEAASEQLRERLSERGVAWRFGQTVVAVDRAGPALVARLASGERLEADLVLSAVGLRADTGLAQAAGLACERGILVDARLQTSAPGVYALGDAAQYQSAGGRTLPFVLPLMTAARALAATLAGQPTEAVFAPMPVAVKTPALPLVVAPPAPGTPGGWQLAGPGEWQWLDPAGALRGFALAGAATPRRSRLAAALAG